MSKGYPMGTTLQGLFNAWFDADPETKRAHLYANGFKDSHISSLIKGSVAEKIALMLADRIEKETGINMRDLSVARAKTVLWGDVGDELPDLNTYDELFAELHKIGERFRVFQLCKAIDLQRSDQMNGWISKKIRPTEEKVCRVLDLVAHVRKHGNLPPPKRADVPRGAAAAKKVEAGDSRNVGKSAPRSVALVESKTEPQTAATILQILKPFVGTQEAVQTLLARFEPRAFADAVIKSLQGRSDFVDALRGALEVGTTENGVRFCFTSKGFKEFADGKLNAAEIEDTRKLIEELRRRWQILSGEPDKIRREAMNQLGREMNELFLTIEASKVELPLNAAELIAEQRESWQPRRR